VSHDMPAFALATPVFTFPLFPRVRCACHTHAVMLHKPLSSLARQTPLLWQ
jgi:hypothetical protein